MPVSELFSSFANKAQSAINSSPLGQHLPHGSGRTASPDPSQQPSANEAAANSGGGSKNHTLEALQYQIRALGQQYSSTTTPVQRIITIAKGSAIDLDSLSRDSKAQSKELYTWGQEEDEDIKDVTDRLAYLNFVQGSLASSLAEKLNAARSPLKTLRDAETAIAPRRNLRTTLATQLARLEHENSKGTEKKMADIREQIKRAELDDAPQEREIELLKRKAIRESEQLKWEAIREYGEKLVLLSQASPPILEALPFFPPTPQEPYKGAQATGAARASLQRALDNYKTGHINLHQQPHKENSTLSRSDTMSFGESHREELEYIGSPTDISHSAQPGLAMTPPATGAAGHGAPHHGSFSSGAAPPSSYPAHAPGIGPSPTGGILSSATSPPPGPSPSISTQQLNQHPASIPSHVSDSGTAPEGAASVTSPIPVAAPHPEKPALPPLHPTVAETGEVISSSGDGPGPASGSLKDIRNQSGGVNADTGKYESADEEKKRLAAEYSAAAAPVPEYNAGPGGPPSGTGDSKKPDDQPPSYQDY